MVEGFVSKKSYNDIKKTFSITRILVKNNFNQIILKLYFTFSINKFSRGRFFKKKK